AREGNDAAPADGILLRLPVPSTCPPPSPGTAAGCTSSTASWTIRPGSRRTPCRRSTIRPAGRRPAGAAAGTRPDLSVGARPATGRAPTGTAPRPPGAGLRVGMRVEALRRLVQEGGDRADAAVTVEGEDVGARGELLTADVEPPQQPGVTVVDLRLPARPERDAPHVLHELPAEADQRLPPGEDADRCGVADLLPEDVGRLAGSLVVRRGVPEPQVAVQVLLAPVGGRCDGFGGARHGCCPSVRCSCAAVRVTVRRPARSMSRLCGGPPSGVDDL